MDVYALLVGVGSAVLILLVAFAIIRSKDRQRKIRQALGLPRDSKLGPEHERAFIAFQDTDLRLANNFPHLAKGQRQALARKILRDKGLLPRGTRRSF